MTDLPQGNPDLVVRRADPLNCEVRLSRLADGTVTPNDRFYIRSHFAVPTIEPDLWRLRVHGLVEKPLELSLRELMQMHAQSLLVTLECAGNGRSFFNPPIEDEPWALGAVSTAEWTGVLLSAVLDHAGVESNATELVFRCGDGNFERSLSLDDARDTPVLLAYSMNGQPLPAHHGYPLRAIVPGWYAVASVKWLTGIELIDKAFGGHYQTERYIFGASEPVRHMRVRSLITQPEDGATVEVGELAIAGLAWSGSGLIERVEVSVNGGAWVQARLGDAERFSWRQWALVTRVDRLGEVVIRSRATDATGNVQPESAEWNRLGYGNNSIQTVTVRAG